RVSHRLTSSLPSTPLFRSLFAYRMPAATFERHDRFWVSRSTVEPLELVEVGDLLALHADAEIELRIAPALLDLWDRVVASTLDLDRKSTRLNSRHQIIT